jgi:UDP-glucose 4-epimerase
MQRTLITGGAGFIGSHLADKLLAAGHEVYVLDDLSTGRMENIAHLQGERRFHLIVESVLHESVVNELVNRCDEVYHLAAAVGVKLIVEQPVKTITTNVRGTEIVLELCGRFEKRLLIASTSEVYGDRTEPVSLREDDRRNYGPTTVNRWAYAASKEIDEFLALAWHREHALDVVIARLFNTVGPRQTGRYGMVIPRFVDAALAGEPLQVHGDGNQTRCFLDVADCVEALVGLMAADGSGEIYNIGSTRSISIGSLARMVIDRCGAGSAVEHIAYADVYGPDFEDMMHRKPATEKINAAIGWTPALDLEETIDRVIADRRPAVVGAASS